MSTAIILAALALAAGDQPAQDAPTAPARPAASAPAAVSGVTVTAVKPDVEVSIDRHSYSIGKDLNATTGNMADVLRNIPGVQIDGSNNISLRGDSNVTVLIDGRPSSQFSSGSPGAALASMAADGIDRVEVMTNPPPEFRADGSGGIINLITKKARGAGHTGSVRLAAADRNIYSLTLTNNFNADKLSITSNAHFLKDNGSSHRDQILSSVDPLTGRTITSSDPTRTGTPVRTVDGGLSADYDLTPHDRITSSLRGQYQAANATAVDTFQQQDSLGLANETFVRHSTGGLIVENGDASLSWKHTYGAGHDLTLNGNFIDTEIRNDRIDLYDPAQPGSDPDPAQRTVEHDFIRQPEFKADYQQALPGKAILKLGYQFDYTANLEEISGGHGNDRASIVGVPGRTDDFSDDQTYHQAYFSYQRPFDKLTVLAGARAEIVHLDLDQQTQNIHTTQNYARLYPNIRASYDLGGGNQWTASYTRRIIRPGIHNLDPFRVTPTTGSTVLEGNPELKPEDISSYELGFEHRKGPNSLQATLYYRSTSNDFSVIATDLGNGQLLGTNVNAGHLLAGGGELAYSRQITPKLNYNFSVDGYWTEINAPNLGVTQVQTLWTGFGRANLAWQITPKDFLQLNAFINGQSLAVQGRTEPSASGNIGYRRVIDPKTSLTVTIKDPFRSLTYRSVYKTNDGSVRMIGKPDGRVFVFALVRTFGGSKAAPPVDFGFAPGGTAGGAGF